MKSCSGTQNVDTAVMAVLGRCSSTTMGPLLVGFILVLCIWTLTIHWLIVWPGLRASDLVLALWVSGIHQVLHFCLVFSLYRACTRDPGYLPRDSLCDATEGPRTCSKCRCAKLDRAHHCR